MTGQPIDPTEVIAEHRLHTEAFCEFSGFLDSTRCLPYRLAEALTAERAKVQRVEALAEQWFAYYGSTAAGAARMVQMALVGDVHACGHVGVVRGCGGCDGGAMESVREDGSPTWRPSTPADFALAGEGAVEQSRLDLTVDEERDGGRGLA